MSGEDDALTRNQALVLDTLSRAPTPLSAYEILDSLRDDGIRAPTQVYRALDTLRARGKVHKLESLNAFVVCSARHEGVSSVLFTICADCGRVGEFADPDLTSAIGRAAGARDFVLHGTTVELRGRCALCAGGQGR